MQRRFALGLLTLTALCLAQSKAVPSFTGTWILDLHRSTFDPKVHPPIAAEVVLRYDGTHWHRWRSHTAPNGKVDAHATDLVLDTPTIVHAGPATITSRITRDGDAMLLQQTIVLNTGEKGTNTVRYTLEDSGKTLIELEHESNPDGEFTNRWVSSRKP